MADILIHGMEMPTSCAVCPFENYGDCYGGKVKVIMDIDDYVSVGKRHPRCPLFSVPDHGRLIDADALERGLRQMAKYQTGERQQGILGCCETIRLAKTIIPASEEVKKKCMNILTKRTS